MSYKVEEFSGGLGAVILKVGEANVIFGFQNTGKRMHLFFHDEYPALIKNAVILELANFVAEMKKQKGLNVILVGKLPTIWQLCQLRPDLEKFYKEYYTGLPDDYRKEGWRGIDFLKEPIKVTLQVIDFNMVSLQETALRKKASIMQQRRDKNGNLRFAPEVGRETDVSDNYLITLALLGAEVANAGEKLRRSYWKIELADLYVRMKNDGLLVEV